MGQVAPNTVLTERGLRSEFIRTLDSTAPHPLTRVATFINSTNLSEKYAALGDVPEMVQFKDTRIAKGLLERSYTLENVRYEATIKLNKDAVRLDQVGDAKIKISEMTQRGKLFPGKLISDLIRLGATAGNVGYDGVTFFNDAHPAEGDSGAGDNLLAGSGVTSAALITDFRAAKAAMRSFRDTAGVPINDGLPMELVIVAPPALEGVWEEVLKAQTVANTTNVLRGAADLIIDARLTDANDWYLLNMAGSLKPLIVQENDPLRFDALMDDSDIGFLTNYHLFGVTWMGTAGYGYWQKAVKTTN